MKFHLSSWLAITASLTLATSTNAAFYFNRVSTFEVCEQIDANCNTDTETVAEIAQFFTYDGMKCLVYTDAEQEQLGFVDVNDPANPAAAGVVPLGGEPTSVSTIGDLVVVGVNTSPDYVNPSGTLDVIVMADKTTVAQLTLPGQPDSVAVSKEDSGYPKYIAIAIENERDEDLGDGSPPQMPPGYLEIITIADDSELADPSTWTQTTIDLTGFPECRFSDDPEPEYVAINDANDCVLITLQENNCNILVDLASMTVANAFDAGEVSLSNIDTLEEDIIRQNSTGTFLREPDGATWLGDTGFFATANEGDLDGGSRGWSIFDSADGSVIYDSGDEMDVEVAKIGHYPDGRSGNKGNEPENVLYVEVDEGSYMFVLAERSNCVFVYEVSDPTSPELLQVLPSGVGPEGIAFDYDSKTLAVTAEKDARDKGFRSSITFYSLVDTDMPFYPTLESMPRADLPDTYIPFSALSGLAASKTDGNVLFTVEDGEFRSTRILCIDTDASPACVFMEDFITDDNGVLSDALGTELVNPDGTVNLDLEGIASDPEGGFWVVSKDHKALICITADHVVEMVVMLTVGCDNLMGVEVDGDNVVVIQGEADDDKPNPLVVVYNKVTGVTKCAQFVLEASLSQYGDDVELTDIAYFDGKFYILQTDPYGGKDAGIKRIDTVDLGDYSFADDSVLTSEFFRDLIPDLTLTNGMVPDDLQALTIDSDGNVFVVNDNGGIGETAFLLVDTIEDGCTDTLRSLDVTDPRSGSVVTGTCADIATFSLKTATKICDLSLDDGTGLVSDKCRATCAFLGKGPCAE